MKSNIVIQPVVSEKSFANANALNKYTFLVDVKASKIEIKKAVESQYKVKVTSINTVIRPGKMKRDYKTYNRSRQSDKKKAIVTLKKGDKINDFLNI